MFINQNQEENYRFIFSNHIAKNKGCLSVIGVNNTLSAYLISQLRLLSNRVIMVLTSNSEEAERYVEEISFFRGNKFSKQVIYFPGYNITPLNQLSYNKEISSKRISCLHSLLESKSDLVVVSDLYSLRQKLIPKKVLIRYTDLIEVKEEINSKKFIDKLFYGGYKRTIITKELGDFSIRGNIIDFFSPLYDNPVRVEFYENIVKSIRFFSTNNQRTISNISQIIVLPASEIVIDRDRLNSTIANLRVKAMKYNLPFEYIKEIISNIKNKNNFSNINSAMPLIYSQMDSLFDYLPISTIFTTIDQSKLMREVISFEERLPLTFKDSLIAKQLFVEKKEMFLNYQTIKNEIISRNSIDYNIIQDSNKNKYNSKLKDKDFFNINAVYNNNIPIDIERYKKGVQVLPIIKILLDNKLKGYSTIIICNSKFQLNRMKSILFSNGLKLNVNLSFPEISRNDSNIYLCIGALRSGFILPNNLLAVIVYNEIFSTKSIYRKVNYHIKQVPCLDIENLKNGEFVVHSEHGIGQYDGLIKLNIKGILSDFLVIIYRDNSRLYLPVERMELLQRYIGIDEENDPILDKMGSKTWRDTKIKVKSSTEKIAKNLLRIYSNRKIKIGHSFSCNNKFLLKFESQFEHKETPDQIKAINDVLTDMGKKFPMDRLICGDVGYGKTEVALRASFVAVNEGKQVAVLVPTTVLAEQHFSTFLNRFNNYSVKIACLSRFKSRTKQRNLINNIKDGHVDIVIGTHRLLQKDVSFLDLGLVILDEEQRFGVKDKEKLKELRNSVDVLALTATPLPRTLYLSLMGLRDISVISTPPYQRRSIITYICEFNYELVAVAIKKELARSGQIFFIHNNISSIEIIAQRLKIYVPEVKLEVAHGQMDEESLERIMISFVNGKIDMLVCTTIIESGIDIVKANTIIINRADRFGLAQLYQIRGRVGRSNQQAYAYLFVPRDGMLGDKASKRFKVLMKYSDLGSGYHIAMNDMKIRGGGTILGSSQSGHIASVGYDMFLKLMKESIANFKGESIKNFIETEINIPLSSFIPENYIVDIDQRLSMYRKLSKTRCLKDLHSLKEEFIDRFGYMPEQTKNLFFKIMLKVVGSCIGFKKITLFDNRLTLFISNRIKYNSLELISILEKKGGYQRLATGGFVKELTGINLMDRLSEVRNILIEIKHHVSS